MSTLTETMHLLREELSMRWGQELTTMAHDGSWHLYQGSPPRPMLLVAGPYTKRELVAWMAGAGHGAMKKEGSDE